MLQTLQHHLSSTASKRMLSLAVPMILSNLCVPLLGLVDTAIVGHLGSAAYLGGVAVGAMIINLLFWLAGFLRMSTTGLVAQAYGAGDESRALLVLARSATLALLIALILLVLKGSIIDLSLQLSGSSQAVQAQARIYFDVRILSAPASLLNLAIIGWLLGMHNARGPMLMLILGNTANILFDLYFVLGLGWGVAGVAWGSVWADYLTLLLGAWLVVGSLARTQVSPQTMLAPRLKDWLVEYASLAAFKRLIALNRDIFLRTLCLQLCFAFITIQGGRMGDEILAANAVLLTFLSLISMGLDGFAYAVEALVGAALGRRSRVELKQVIRLGFLYSLGLGVFFCLFFFFAGELIIAGLTDLQAIREQAHDYLPYLIIMPLLSLWCYLLDGVFIGAARAADMRNSMLISMLFGFFLPWWLLRELDNHALWLALCGFMLLRGGSLAWLLRRDWPKYLDEHN